MRRALKAVRSPETGWSLPRPVVAAARVSRQVATLCGNPVAGVVSTLRDADYTAKCFLWMFAGPKGCGLESFRWALFETV